MRSIHSLDLNMRPDLNLISVFPVSIKEEAIAPLLQLSLEENMPPRLRISIEGGGCSGFKYAFQFDETSLEDDLIQKFGDIEIVIDPISALYVQGSILNYIEDLQGSRFEMKNPLASHTCSCGSSFSA